MFSKENGVAGERCCFGLSVVSSDFVVGLKLKFIRQLALKEMKTLFSQKI